MPSVKWLLGFAKAPYQGRPPRPSPGPLRMPPKIIQKRRTRYHPRGTSRWRTCEVTLRFCRGTVPGAPPSPYTRPQECPKIGQKTYLVPGPKARLRQGTFEKPWKNPPGKSPAKSSKIYTTRIPDTFLPKGRPYMIAPFFSVFEEPNLHIHRPEDAIHENSWGQLVHIFETQERKKQHINIKKRTEHPPISDPTLKFFMWGPLLLENKGEGATHINNLGLHWGPHSFFMWVVLSVLFALPINYG